MTLSQTDDIFVSGGTLICGDNAMISPQRTGIKPSTQCESFCSCSTLFLAEFGLYKLKI